MEFQRALEEKLNKEGTDEAEKSKGQGSTELPVTLK